MIATVPAHSSLQKLSGLSMPPGNRQPIPVIAMASCSDIRLIPKTTVADVVRLPRQPQGVEFYAGRWSATIRCDIVARQRIGKTS